MSTITQLEGASTTDFIEVPTNRVLKIQLIPTPSGPQKTFNDLPLLEKIKKIAGYILLAAGTAIAAWAMAASGIGLIPLAGFAMLAVGSLCVSDSSGKRPSLSMKLGAFGVTV